MIFRGRQPEATVWRRFRSGLDGFTFGREGDVYVAHVSANAERVLDLLHALSVNLPPAVDVAIEDRRSGAAWTGENVARPDGRDAVARLKLPLAAYGGVELAIYTPDDQLTLSDALDLFAYGRTDRWLYILLGKGLAEQEKLPVRRWELAGEPPPAPELENALALTIERLGLDQIS